mmetsp:Transcript_11377/g.34189  ORF Transcript_11377/g.34189 Transcript_11377/m.34189 type:complete len:216 (-) Transcript_11377:2455-3102(-)
MAVTAKGAPAERRTMLSTVWCGAAAASRIVSSHSPGSVARLAPGCCNSLAQISRSPAWALSMVPLCLRADSAPTSMVPNACCCAAPSSFSPLGSPRASVPASRAASFMVSHDAVSISWARGADAPPRPTGWSPSVTPARSFSAVLPPSREVTSSPQPHSITSSAPTLSDCGRASAGSDSFVAAPSSTVKRCSTSCAITLAASQLSTANHGMASAA